MITGVLLNLCVAPAASLGRLSARLRQEAGSFAGVDGRTYSPALTTTPRPYSDVPAAKQLRVRHPALDLTALPPQNFQLSSLSLRQGALDNHQLILQFSFSVQPQGRAPPVSD
ncbi:MAG TPA: hypothetical protein VHR36_16430 [Pyrinomonadaceae bacterium]|nr:hypothetical protein [Pyrinomonadaceae bacterium]